ncbi:efflux RND transporter periplasmic adaptor subunit [Paenibacillus xanthanilyticus]|uniref:Efflux RND transporter periplasmic adaptor subunit n=1 Tax=Paenibacillus xanthanilyticus TaxID=1783531 RepID=A0ABV8KDB2_9BACL
MFTKWLTENSFKRTAAVLLGASMLLASGCSLLPKEAEEEVLPEINPPAIAKKPEYEVTTTTLETKVLGSGKLISLKEETLYFTLDGKRLKELNIKAGQKVTAGQVIGSLDVDDLKKTLRTEQLNFKKAEVEMKKTLRERDTMDPIAYEMAVINFEENRQKLADMQEEIDKATLVAPFAGTVVQLNVMKGDQIKAYDPICIIADGSDLVAAVNMTQDELKGVTVGMPASVEINNGGTVEGKVKQLPIVTEENGNGNGNGNGGIGGNNGQNIERPEKYLLVSLNKIPAGVTRGSLLSLNIITKRKENAIVIPPSALRTIGSRTYVQVVEAEGKREVDVEVGQQTATEIEIVKGLTPGQKVVGR